MKTEEFHAKYPNIDKAYQYWLENTDVPINKVAVKFNVSKTAFAAYIEYILKA